MNYLAHAYLSFNDPEILVGNLISDFVKGKKKYDYPEGIQKGITIHRAIDTFTDDHPVTKRAKEVFRESYRLYSGAFVDVVYDHFLATDKTIFPGDSLLNFSLDTYKMMEEYLPVFPEKFRLMFPYMKKFNWLYNYQFNQGIERSFEGVARRAVYLSESEKAYRIFIENYQFLQEAYQEFFPALHQFIRNSSSQSQGAHE